MAETNGEEAAAEARRKIYERLGQSTYLSEKDLTLIGKRLDLLNGK